MSKFTDIAEVTWGLMKEPNRVVSMYQDYKYNKRQKVFKRLFTQEIPRIAAQISNWRNALQSWESASNPDRYDMIQLYNEIALDDQVTTKMETVVKRVAASEYYFYDTGSKTENKDIMPTFDRRWFLKFIQHTVEADFYGHSLIQFGNWNSKGYNHKEMELVFRWLVSPEMGIVRKSASVMDGIPFREGPFARHLVEIGDKYDKGVFAAVAPLYIFKKNAMSFWSDYQQRFGEPMVTFNTDITNEKNVERLLDFITNRGKNSGAVLDYNEVANLLEADKTDAFRVYHEMINLCNAGIAKMMEGQVMTSESSDGKYKGDVHADTALLFHLGRLKSIRYYINDELLPKMRRDGFLIPETLEFRWREVKDIDQIVNRITKLAFYYEIDPELVYDLTGIKVGKRIEETDARAGNMKVRPDKNDG